VIVNNAGIFEPVSVDADTDAWNHAWDRVLRVNLHAPAELCKLAIPHFRTHGGGKIINVASRAAHRGDAPDQWPYAASKGALVALTWIGTAFLTRISSLSALIAIAASPVYAWLLADPQRAQLALFIAALVWLRHHENIRRLLKGEEPRIGKRKPPPSAAA